MLSLSYITKDAAKFGTYPKSFFVSDSAKVMVYNYIAHLFTAVTFFSAFKALIGNLDELTKKDYGDLERGATR